jgi:hypothetical protein
MQNPGYNATQRFRIGGFGGDFWRTYCAYEQLWKYPPPDNACDGALDAELTAAIAAGAGENLEVICEVTDELIMQGGASPSKIPMVVVAL